MLGTNSSVTSQLPINVDVLIIDGGMAGLSRFLRQNWHGIGKCVSLHCCPYTMTKDTLFVLDRLPSFPLVTIFTGGSGQAFKFAPILGKLLSELLLEQELSVDITPFNIQRIQLNLAN